MLSRFGRSWTIPLFRVPLLLAGDNYYQSLMEWNIAPTATRAGLMQDFSVAVWCEVLLCLAQYSCGLRFCVVASANSYMVLHLPLYPPRLGSGLPARVPCICCISPILLALHRVLMLAWLFFSKSMCVLHVIFLSGDITQYCRRLH